LYDRFGIVSCGNLGTDKDKITPRLFWVGLAGGWGTPVELRGLADGGNLSLRYTGSQGIFNLFWKDWVDWIMKTRKAVKIEKQMGFIELKDIDFTKRYRMNGINYLISEISVTLNKSSIKSAQLTCFACP
jgi:hypothetical protein